MATLPVCCAGSRQVIFEPGGILFPGSGWRCCRCVAASASGVGVQLCPLAPGGDAVTSCAAAAISAGVGGPPSASAAVPGSSGRQQHQETSRPSRGRRRSSSDGTGRASKKRPRGRSPSPGPSSRRRERSYRSSSESSEVARAETSPPRAGRAPGGTPGDFRPAPAGDRSPHPGPSGWTARSSVRAERYRSGAGRRSPSPSGVADDDRSSAFDTVDFDRDDSFRSVLGLIRNFHSMEEPVGIPSARCKTSLASIYGLMSETSPAFHLPTSPLVRSLLDDTNLALSKFLEDQTVHSFLPVPGRRHRRYYRTSSTSFPRPYSVPPGVTSITLEKASEARKRSISLSASQVSSLETMLSGGVCEVSSWLDWWLSTCGGFREHLPNEVRADFERLILSGSRALEFLASQGCTALGNLVLSRRDSLLADVHSTVPAEEVARLRYSPLPETVFIFPSTLLDSALTKMRAAANDALVQRTLHPPRIPQKPAAAGGSAGSSASGSGQASSSGARPAQKQTSSSSPSGQAGKKRKNRKGKAPFSSSSGGSGRSGGKAKEPERSRPDGTTLPVRVGGCLAPHWRRWQAIGAESWVVTVLRDGYRVPFLDSPPPLSRTPVSFPMYRAGSPRAQALWQEVEAMLAKGALEIAQDPGPGFYSRLFLVEKASGGWRPVIDLSHLNEFIQLTRFKMETVASVLLSVREGDFLASLDLKDAYFQIPIHPSSRKLLRFTSEGTVYQFRALCFKGCPPLPRSQQGLRSRVSVGTLSRDQTSPLSGRLVGSLFLGAGSQAGRPVAPLALSHPRDCDKREEVRSHALADCEVSRHDHRYRGRQGFSVSGASREIPDGSGELLYHGRSPSSALAGDPRSPGFARAAGSS